MGSVAPGLWGYASGAEARRSLHQFVRQAFRVLFPSEVFIDGPHIEALCLHLSCWTYDERMTRRKAVPVRNLIVNMPPATSKSIICSVFCPCWLWTRVPSSGWVFFSHDAGLVLRDSQYRRMLIESEWYRTNWPFVEFSKDENQKSRYKNTIGGWMLSGSVGSGFLTGEHPNYIVGDDPNEIRRSESKQERQKVKDFWRTVATRGVGKRVRKLVVQQRTHEDDLTGHIETTSPPEEKWVKVVLPMRYEPERRCETGVQGWADWRTEPGQLLCPEMLPEPSVRVMEANLGIRAAGQLQQRPALKGGNLVKEAYFRYFRTTDDGTAYELLDEDGGVERTVEAEACSYWFQTADTALKAGDENDYTVVLTACITPPPVRMLVQHVYRNRLEVPHQYGMLIKQRKMWPRVSMTAVEDKASGIGLLQQARLDGLAFEALKPGTQDKQQRASTVITCYKDGLVYHPTGAAWVGDFEAELVAFPTGEFDDQVDAAAYAGMIFQRVAWGRLTEERSMAGWPNNKRGEADEDPSEDGPSKPSLAEQLTGRRPGASRRRIPEAW